MQPIDCFSDADRQTLLSVLQRVKSNPYTEFVDFQRDVRHVIEAGEIPVGFADACLQIKQQRDRGVSNVHVLHNCPIDPDVPQLDPADPVKDKYRKKLTLYEGDIDSDAGGTRAATRHHNARFQPYSVGIVRFFAICEHPGG